ncbi:unnamed protein product [Strongylus vulgaris]|uniref:Mitochondrial carrier protein n=1 Tax=Strongylus vulgaris TaxID=40348 RepID=A0A3P7IYQ2_STRVU|nr:unnamed protein product [Strongylus vulgaris]
MAKVYLEQNSETTYQGLLFSFFLLSRHTVSTHYTFRADCAKQTWRSGGISIFSKVRALYSGSAVNIVLITPEKAIKLVANDFFRHHLAVPGEKTLSAWRGMIAGGLAGMGLGSTFARDVTFSMIYFPLFAYLDSLGPRKSDGSGDAVFWTSFVAGLASGASASFAVTPLDGVSQHLRILQMEGPKALFKGAACRMMVMAPLFGIAQTVYYIGVAEKILGVQKTTHV